MILNEKDKYRAWNIGPGIQGMGEKYRFTFSKKMKIILFSLLIVLNLILRIPFYPHEYGHDSFVIHILANSVSQFGYAKWWLNPLSVFGLYPFSVCSAVPFILSELSQITGVDMEHVILLFCFFLGISIIFMAYIFAGVIWDNDIFKFLVAFGLSLSPSILNYLTWTITTRAPFIALLPLFVYTLFKCRTYKLRFALLTVMLFILLFATHHLVYFIIPVLIGYLIVVASYKIKRCIKSVMISHKYITFVLIIGYFTMFAIPFITRHFIEGSRYEAITELFFGYLPRYTGILGIFAVGGFVYLLFKRGKKNAEWCLLLILMFLTPFLYIETYMKWFIPCFIFPFTAIGLINVLKLNGRRRKFALFIIINFLLLSVSFSAFYQHWRTKGGKIHLFENYMKESTYTAGLWAKENIRGTTTTNDIVFGIKIFSISEVPHMSAYYDVVDLSYGLANINGSKLIKRSITTEDFWFSGPYAKRGGYSSKEYGEAIMGMSYEDYKYSKYLSIFNFTYFLENKRAGKTPLLRYIQENNYCVYDNGYVNIWTFF